MELLQLKYFCDAAKSENFSKTAKTFSVPPSGISQSIRRLETELGRPLFDRKANKVTLNAFGKEFYEKVSAALSQLGEGVKLAKEYEECETLSICIHTNRRIVMQAVERFQKAWPGVSIHTRFLSEGTPDEFDLMISPKAERFPSFESQKLVDEVLAIAIDKKMLKGNTVRALSDCRDLPFITMRTGTHHFLLTAEICGKYGFHPHIALQSDDPFYIRKCVELGLGITLAPTLSWRGLFSENVSLIPLSGESRSTYLYMKKSPSPAAKRMIELLFEEFKKEQNQ